MRLGVRSLVAIASALAGAIGCRGIVEPGTLVNSIGVIVSAPVSPTFGAAAVGGRYSAKAGSALQVVYVSLPPDSVPMGVSATITDHVTGLSTTTPVVNGGFDPVPIVANVGDTLTIEITGPGTPALAEVVVAAARPIKIVRTSPPSGGRDVPLNAIIMIVFSDPVDTITLTSGAVQLQRDTTPVVGTLQFADSAHLRAEFLPAALLAPQTNYRLVVTRAIRDVNGLALDSPLAVSFTTGSSTQPRLTTIEPTSVLVRGPAFTLTVNGTEFVPASTVNFGGTALATTFVSATQLTAAVPAAAVATPGNVAVTVTSPASEGGTSDTMNFVITFPFVFTSVSAGGTHTCAIAAGGNGAFCWGLNYLGQLGDQSTTNRTSPVPVFNNFTAPPQPQQLVSVSAKARHTCGVTSAGYGYCWGYGPDGIGGSGPAWIPLGPAAVLATPYDSDLTFTVVSAGGEDTAGAHTCGVTITGAAYCWGSNSSGQLGDGTTAPHFWPYPVSGGLSFASVSAGGSFGNAQFTCGVTTSGAAYCWGGNTSGQLGDGTTNNQPSPVAVLGGLTFEAVSAGGAHTCGITTAGAAYCWGANASGQLGDGTTTARTAPVAVLGGQNFATISAGEDAHSCGVTTAGAAYCWGDNSAGQIGDSTTNARATPVAVRGGFNLADVSAGRGHTCGVTRAGVVYCWGANGWGQLGNGTTASSSVPVKVAGQP